METSNTLIDQINLINGGLASIATVLILYTLYRTCRFKRDEKTQDKLGTFFQNWFHIGMYLSVFLISFDRFTKMSSEYAYLTYYVSPPLIEFTMCVTAFCWCGYRLRRHYLKSTGRTLMDDLQVKPGKINEESTII